MQLITQKFAPGAIFPSLSATKAVKYKYQLGVSLCPTMDLVATYPILMRSNSSQPKFNSSHDSDSDNDATGIGATQQEYVEDDEDSVNLDVWRFNGQRVFSITVENDEGGRVEICNVDWRSNGQMLAILSFDNILRLVDSFSGKVVHRFSSLPTYAAPPSPKSPRTRRSSTRSARSNQTPKPSAISYSSHFSDPRSTRTLLGVATTENSTVLDDLLSSNADISSLLKSPADLPRELAYIDVESFLPRLSCLPPVGFGGEDVFSTRTSVDAIFHSSKKDIQRGTVDVLTAGHRDGMITLRIFDSFELGGLDLNSAVGMRKTARVGPIIKMAGWPLSSRLFYIAEDTRKNNLHVLGVDLKFITHNPNALPILATKATQLQNLLRYLTQIHSQLAREMKSAFDLPTRFLRNINEDLERQDGVGASFRTAAYHAIVTGEVTGAFKEWLNEQVGERGIKRWEKSVGDCLELVRRLISEAWCPAVERAGVVISRLSGLAGWSVQEDLEGFDLGLDKKLVDGLKDTVDVMAICGEECLRDVIKEIGRFTGFIKWLKWEVEASALEDTSERLDEMRESSDHGDVMEVLDYIDTGPQESVVKNYLGSTTTSAATHGDDDVGYYASFMEQRKRSGADGSTPDFDQLLGRMRRQCDQLFERIAQSLRQSIIPEYVTDLGSEMDKSTVTLRTVPSLRASGQPKDICLHVIARKSNDRACIVHRSIEIENTQHQNTTAMSRIYCYPGAKDILDVQFVDDDSFMVLARTSDSVKIYSCNIAIDQGDVVWESRHEFKDGFMESGMKPARLCINGRKKRRVVGVIDEDGKGYVVFDLDSSDGGQGEDVEDETMTG